MRITFVGAAGEVTGSCSLLETNGRKFLIDCGMFQGTDFDEIQNHESFPFDPKEISAVFITHAHLDHVGRLPLLAKQGFLGHVYATPATLELAKLILDDALEIMQYNHEKFNTPVLYSETDIANIEALFKPINYYKSFTLPFSIAPQLQSEVPISAGLQVTFRDSGHIFGAAFIEFEAEGKKVVFSGDVGNVNVPILRDTDPLPTDLDLMVCESTYGNRIHESSSKRQEIIEHLISGAIGRGGVLMIPTFSLERTQELLYDLSELVDHHRLPHVPIFLDSPLAINALAVYRKYPEYYDAAAKEHYTQGEDFFNFPGLVMCPTREESKRINQTPGPKIIIAGAGMMNGGRIVHHALRYLSDDHNTLLIVGYQAKGTLGRQILDGQSPVKVLDESVQVRCQVKAIGALSAHADQAKLTSWIGSAKPKRVFLNHGELEASTSLAEKINALGIDTELVKARLSIEV